LLDRVNTLLVRYRPTVRSSLWYKVSSVCLFVVCNACIVAKPYVVWVGDGNRTVG